MSKYLLKQLSYTRSNTMSRLTFYFSGILSRPKNKTFSLEVSSSAALFYFKLFRLIWAKSINTEKKLSSTIDCLENCMLSKIIHFLFPRVSFALGLLNAGFVWQLETWNNYCYLGATKIREKFESSSYFYCMMVQQNLVQNLVVLCTAFCAWNIRKHTLTIGSQPAKSKMVQWQGIWLNKFDLVGSINTTECIPGPKSPRKLTNQKHTLFF